MEKKLIEVEEVYGWRIVIKRLESISDRRDEYLALVILDMENEAEEEIERYKDRCRIEMTFYNMESNAFKISKMQFRDSTKVKNVILCDGYMLL